MSLGPEPVLPVSLEAGAAATLASTPEAVSPPLLLIPVAPAFTSEVGAAGAGEIEVPFEARSGWIACDVALYNCVLPPLFAWANLIAAAHCSVACPRSPCFTKHRQSWNFNRATSVA